MSYLDISMLTNIFYFMVGISIFQFVLAGLNMFGNQLRSHYPRLQEHLDKVSAGVFSHPHIVFHVFVIAKAKSIMLNDDHPHNASVYLICLSLLGVTSFCNGLMHGARGFVSNFFVIVVVTTELANMAICFFPYVLPPAIFIIFSILYVLLIITYKMQLTNDVIVVNARQTRLENLVNYGLRVSVAMGIAIVAASLVWPDFETDYRRTIGWLSLFDCVAFWALTAAKLL